MNKILLAFANANEDLELSREAANIFKTDGLNEHVQMIPLLKAGLDDLTREFRQHKNIAIFHFGGHAGNDRIEGERLGEVEQMFADGLTSYISEQEHLQLVFLNGCSTANLAEQLIKKGIPYVIATSSAIKDSVAIDFAKCFYSELAANIPIEEAYRKAKHQTQTRLEKPHQAYNRIIKAAFEKEDQERGLNLNRIQDDGLPFQFFMSKDAEDWRIKSPSKQLRAYYNTIKKLYHEKALNEKVAQLSDLYIVPDFKIHSICFGNEDETDKEGFKDEVHSNIHQFVLDVFLQKNTEGKYCKTENERLLILLGQPGQGKTSFCARLVNDLTTNDKYRWDKKCYFLRLRDVPSPVDFINHPFRETTNYFEEENISFHPDHSLLILDGLDELSMSAGLTNANIKNLIHGIQRKLENKHKNLYIIITSRYNYFQPNEIDGDTTLLLKLQQLNLQQQKTWLRNYKKFHPNLTLTIQKLEEINGSDNDNFKHIKELINQPILLHLIAQTNFEVSNQDNRATIYTKLFDTLTRHSWNKKGLKRYSKDFPDELRAYISEVAYQIYISDYEYIKRKELEELPATTDFIENSLNTQKDLNEALKEVLVSFYFRNKEKDEADKLQHSESNKKRKQRTICTRVYAQVATRISSSRAYLVHHQRYLFSDHSISSKENV